MKTKYCVSMVTFVPTGEGTDIMPVPVKKWKGLSQIEALELLIETIKKHPGAVPDCEGLDSVTWKEIDGRLYSMYVEK